MNTIRDNELALPSGFEVESATVLPPIEAGATPVTYDSGINSSRQSGLRGKLDSLKSRGSEKLHHLQHRLHDRTAMARSSLRTNVDRQVTNVNTSMRTNPMKWVGIAAGAGFGIGLIGRFVHWRNHHKHMAPSLVIIESNW